MSSALHVEEEKNLLSIQHDGSITWDEIQAIKNRYWGTEAEAIEVYPKEKNVINPSVEFPEFHWRHIWRVLPGNEIPDLTTTKYEATED